MKAKLLPAICALCFLWNPAMGEQTGVENKGLQYQRIVTGITDLTGNLPDPLEVFNKSKANKEQKFDAAAYFNVLKKISLPEDKTLDYFFHLQGSAGYPVLYVRSKHQKPYDNMEEYRKSPGYSNSSRDEMMAGIVNGLEVKDNEDGYFEYAVFYLMAPRFYLWKWAKTEYEIICHETRLKDLSGSNKQIPRELADAAKKLDLTPQVHLTPDKAEVSIITFDAGGGFFRERFIIARSSPHRLLDHTRLCLIEYNSGIRY